MMALELRAAPSGGGLILRDTNTRDEIFVDAESLRRIGHQLVEAADDVDLSRRAGNARPFRTSTPIAPRPRRRRAAGDGR